MNPPNSFQHNEMVGEGSKRMLSPSQLGYSSLVAERPSFIHSGISSHIREIVLSKYPDDSIKIEKWERSIASMERCGEESGWFAIRECGCGSEFIPLSHHCDLRICPVCSKRRTRRIFSQFLPFFKRYPVTRSDFFQFLTISPKNYSDDFSYVVKKDGEEIVLEGLEAGSEHLRNSFSKFVRRKYIKSRIKAGFYVIEAVETWPGKPQYDKKGNFLYYHTEHGWNLHLHIVIYGAWLDYRLRGRCLECNQNLLRYDKEDKKFFCANGKCGSKNVIKFEDTKLGREWKKSSGSFAHIYGEKVRAVHGAIAYLTKYISTNKDNFLDDKSVALYIVATRKRKLINSFGKFFKDRGQIQKPVYTCQECNQTISYWFDIEASLLHRDFLDKPPDPVLGWLDSLKSA